MTKAGFSSAALLLAVALSAGPALAGTYVSGPLPSEFGGGFVPPSPDILKNLQKASKLTAKFGAAVEKCYSKGAANVSKGKDSGLLECLLSEPRGVVARHITKIGAIAAKPPGLPPCYDFEVPGVEIFDAITGLQSLVYCQSPSGAFLDGAATF